MTVEALGSNRIVSGHPFGDLTPFSSTDNNNKNVALGYVARVTVFGRTKIPVAPV